MCVITKEREEERARERKKENNVSSLKICHKTGMSPKPNQIQNEAQNKQKKWNLIKFIENITLQPKHPSNISAYLKLIKKIIFQQSNFIIRSLHRGRLQVLFDMRQSPSLYTND